MIIKHLNSTTLPTLSFYQLKKLEKQYNQGLHYYKTATGLTQNEINFISEIYNGYINKIQSEMNCRIDKVSIEAILYAINIAPNPIIINF